MQEVFPSLEIVRKMYHPIKTALATDVLSELLEQGNHDLAAATTLDSHIPF